VIKYPTSPASKAIRRIASGLIGVSYKDEEDKEQKEGFLERFTKAVFAKKKGN
jgi:MinD-like ATPase involved in chromosome partitioning or flagellar assembly